MENYSEKDSSIEAYRAVYKDSERIWSIMSKTCGLSDAEYWALIMIREGYSTQSEISEHLSMNKQTIHSALKQLIKKGIVRLETNQNNLRVKQIIFTDEGIRFAEKYIDSMLFIEEKVWTKMTTDENESLIRLTRKYNCLLKSELQQYLKS